MRLFTQDQLAQSRAVTSGFIPSDGCRQDAVAAAAPIESELREEIAKLHAQLAAVTAERDAALAAAAAATPTASSERGAAISAVVATAIANVVANTSSSKITAAIDDFTLTGADALQGETLGPQAPETVEAIDSLSQPLRDGGDAATAAALRERFGCK